ncbi:MAG TPA: XRE family transcriptional regulator [Firmicutes bacterium]|nr:XRE family transcriptional regulator [Bacillota bacterium]
MKYYNYKGRRNLIGQNVRAARKRLSPPLTQEQLAMEMARRGCEADRFVIMHIESGQRFVADYEVKVLAEILGMSLEEIYREEA